MWIECISFSGAEVRRVFRVHEFGARLCGELKVALITWLNLRAKYRRKPKPCAHFRPVLHSAIVQSTTANGQPPTSEIVEWLACARNRRNDSSLDFSLFFVREWILRTHKTNRLSILVHAADTAHYGPSQSSRLDDYDDDNDDGDDAWCTNVHLQEENKLRKRNGLFCGFRFGASSTFHFFLLRLLLLVFFSLLLLFCACHHTSITTNDRKRMKREKKTKERRNELLRRDKFHFRIWFSIGFRT